MSRRAGVYQSDYNRKVAEEKRPSVKSGLFIDGGGRITCGELRCAGATAFYSSMTLDMNGATIEKVTQAHAIGFAVLNLTLACESCGQAYEGGK